MAPSQTTFAAGAAEQPFSLAGWLGAWGGQRLWCCSSAAVQATVAAPGFTELDESITIRKIVDSEEITAGTPSTDDDTTVGSPTLAPFGDSVDGLPVLLCPRSRSASRSEQKFAPGEGGFTWLPENALTPKSFPDEGEFVTAEDALSPASVRGERDPEVAGRGAQAEPAKVLHPLRTPSFEADYRELPELRVPDKEQPLVRGHIEANFYDIAETMFRTNDSPFTKFLCGVMGCSEMNASPFIEEGAANTKIQRSNYKLPLPSDIPEVAAHLLGLGKHVTSATVTRAVTCNGRITLQQISRTEGVLYSERMRVMNIHFLEPSSSGGVAWRTYTRIMWLKPLPWTHTFIAKIIENRAKAETKVYAPQLMRAFKDAARGRPQQ